MIASRRTSHPAASHNGLIVGEWSVLTVVAATVATLVDGYLLDRKIGLLTGGFLADVHLASALSRAWFFAMSMVSDAGVLGMVVALVLWICATLQLRPAGRVLFTLGFALLPVAWFDVVSYQIHQYIGDVFTVAVLFDLSGRSVREFLAVAGPQIAALVALLVAGVVAIFGVAWVLNRVLPLIEGDDEFRWSRGRLVAKLALSLFFGSVVVTTAARVNSELVERGLSRKAPGVLVTRLMQVLTDVDRDGYGLLGRPPDPAPFDASVHPYAIEVPGNGIDENGVGGDLPLAEAGYREVPADAPRFARQPPVIFVILETVRADVIGQRREGREVTPFLNATAAVGSFSDRAYSHNGWTIGSRFHSFTGSLGGPRRVTSLIDDFNANGYETAFFSAQDESFGDDLDVGFKRAAVAYDGRQDIDLRFSASTSPGSLGVPHQVVEKRIREWLARRDASRPLFLHVNLQETHYPYNHSRVEPLFTSLRMSPQDMRPGRRADIEAVYANAAANVDGALGRITAAVREHTGQDPLFIAIADHGESLFDDGLLGHGIALTDTQTRVPLIVSEPGWSIPEPFGQVDLRDFVWRMLGVHTETPVADATHLGGQKMVLQYMGDLRTARQIALVTRRGRIRVDFQEREVDYYSGQWAPMSSLEGEAQAEVLKLIHRWEAVVRASAPR
jgi:hypothetical protein